MKWSNFFVVTGLGIAVVSGVIANPMARSAAQSATQQIVRVDVVNVAAGQRASKIIHSKVLNEQNETVGSIDDLIVTPSNNVPFAILSVGGFLGVGDRLVVVPFNTLRISEKGIILPGGDKKALLAQPEFHYR